LEGRCDAGVVAGEVNESVATLSASTLRIHTDQDPKRVSDADQQNHAMDGCRKVGYLVDGGLLDGHIFHVAELVEHLMEVLLGDQLVDLDDRRKKEEKADEIGAL